MLIPILLFILGLVMLVKGGDWFVDGATGIAEQFHVPDLIIGATIVSIGTTLPEVMVSAASAVSGHGEIAYGNAIGSIICNTALVAAITIAVRPTKIDTKPLKIPVLFFFLAAAVYCVNAYLTGFFGYPIGFTLLFLLVLYLMSSVASARNGHETEDAAESSGRSLGINTVLLIVGAALIAVGANLLVDNGTLIAKALGVPESVIALTFVALGTSLPELVTAITSLIKGHGALSLGNVIGANIFNLVLVSGVATVLKPFSIPQNSMIANHNASLVLDIPVMLTVMAILTVPTLLSKKLHRMQGIVLLMIYAAFCTIQFML